MKKSLLIVFAALAFSGLASASLIPTLNGGAPTGTGPYTWSYTAHVSGDEQIGPMVGNQCSASPGSVCPTGSYFTIYDINGYNGVASAPANWTFTTQLIGITPINPGIGAVPAADSPSVVNITYAYTGPATPSAASMMELTFSPFTFQSTSNVVIMGNSSFSAIKFGVPGFDGGVNPVQVPGVPTGIPEPASMLLIGGGLVGLAFARRKLVR